MQTRSQTLKSSLSKTDPAVTQTTRAIAPKKPPPPKKKAQPSKFLTPLPPYKPRTGPAVSPSCFSPTKIVQVIKGKDGKDILVSEKTAFLNKQAYFRKPFNINGTGYNRRQIPGLRECSECFSELPLSNVPYNSLCSCHTVNCFLVYIYEQKQSRLPQPHP